MQRCSMRHVIQVAAAGHDKLLQHGTMFP
jgi:hypothetical protein